MRDLGLPAGTASRAYGINNAGQVAGTFQYPNSSIPRPFVWQNGVFIDLSPVLGKANCVINDINDAGQMIGGCRTNIDGANTTLFRLTPVAAVAGDLSVALTAAPLTGTVGLPFVYTATVTNVGNATSINVILTQTLPAIGLTVTSVLPSQGACNGINVVTCDLGDVASGASVIVTITVTPITAGNYNGSVAVMSSTPEVNTMNNTAQAVFSVIQDNADINISSSNSQVSAIRGGNITYIWTVGNNGSGQAFNVKLSDVLPSSLSLVSATTTAGTCTGTTTVSCSFGNVRYGSSVTVTIVARVKVRGTITNRATVTSTTPDRSVANNTTSVVTRVR